MAWSLERQADLPSYAVKRFFRIYPLYFIAITLQTIFFSLHLKRGFPDLFSDIIRYYGANLCFLNFLMPSIGNVLDGLRVGAINGSLWTLKIEVAFYVLVPFLLQLRKRVGPWILILAFAASCVYSIFLPSVTWSQQLPGRLRFFVLGILLFYYGQVLDLPRPDSLWHRVCSVRIPSPS
jgi:peptidoglycan/LPS O-acetylase OafA/YrhL